GDSMIRLAYSQRSLVEVLLPDGEKLWDPVLRRIDAELEDEGLLDVMVEALARRHPLSQRRGRPGTPATVVLRMLVLKHLFDWSFDECEREVRANLVYRAFCRIEGECVPDAKTLIRLAQVLDGPTLKQLLERLVVIAGAGASCGGGGCASTPPWSRRTSTIHPTAPSWRMASAC